MDFNYIVVPAIVAVALVLVACGALLRIIAFLWGEQSRARKWKEASSSTFTLISADFGTSWILIE